jgi:hypothetical protein
MQSGTREGFFLFKTSIAYSLNSDIIYLIMDTVYPYHRKAPVTGRKAEGLVQRYGFGTVAEFAEALPDDALVADLAAGKSNLGLKVSKIRSDITWVNVDLRRGIFNYPKRQQQKGRSNFSYFQGDIFALPFRRGVFDRVYSSWFLPHAALDSTEIAMNAVHCMAELLNSEGALHIAGFGASARVTAKNYDIDPVGAAEFIVNRVKIADPYSENIQRSLNDLHAIFQRPIVP